MELESDQIISSSRFLQAVTGPSLTRLRDMAVLKRYARGAMIFRQGEPCPGVFVVGRGLVRVYKIAPSGKEHVLHMVAPGGNFAEVAAIGGFACPAFAEALEDAICVLLPSERFNRALREDHQLCLQLLVGMSGWVKHLLAIVEDMTLRDALGRVARYLLALADEGEATVQLPSLKKHLASHLNLTSETLSRTLRRLSEMQLIRSDGEGIVLLDRAGLADVVEGALPMV
jgi:CRP/FNR family transcriptional regulator